MRVRLPNTGAGHDGDGNAIEFAPGSPIELPQEEAQSLIDRGIAELVDDSQSGNDAEEYAEWFEGTIDDVKARLDSLGVEDLRMLHGMDSRSTLNRWIEDRIVQLSTDGA
ncbi:MAG: hypothetical protein KJN72_12125 [Woeseia sp.]|nr:hypothetical protein [Woeseia sp.]